MEWNNLIWNTYSYFPNVSLLFLTPPLASMFIYFRYRKFNFAKQIRFHVTYCTWAYLV
jgi:hypothetical protein